MMDEQAGTAPGSLSRERNMTAKQLGNKRGSPWGLDGDSRELATLSRLLVCLSLQPGLTQIGDSSEGKVSDQGSKRPSFPSFPGYGFGKPQGALRSGSPSSRTLSPEVGPIPSLLT